MKNLIIVFAFTTLTIACGNKNVNVTESSDIKKGVLIEDRDEFPESSSYEISSAQIQGNQILIDLGYSGGCEEHEFILYGLKTTSSTDPVERNIFVHHNSNGDACREYITETISFNISDFIVDKGSEMVLNLEGYKSPLTYKLK